MLLAVGAAVSLVASGCITSVAGTGVVGFNGDDRLATTATLAGPAGVAVDGVGNLYIADAAHNRVRRVDAITGFITTVAGTGLPDYNGDNQLAASAQLSSPQDVALDGAGNLYIAETGNSRVRRVDATTGLITTVAGTFSGLGTTTGGYNGDGRPATSAQLNYPNAIAADRAGNLYIADTNNDRVRRVDALTGVIVTVAGTGTGGFNGDGQPATSAQLGFPQGVAVDGAGNLYIGDSFNWRVRRVDAVTGVIATVVGGGTDEFSTESQLATSVSLNTPVGIEIDRAGTLYVVASEANRVCRIDAVTGRITTLAGTGMPGFNGDNRFATIAQLNRPRGVAVDTAGKIYIADTDNDRVRRVG